MAEEQNETEETSLIGGAAADVEKPNSAAEGDKGGENPDVTGDNTGDDGEPEGGKADQGADTKGESGGKEGEEEEKPSGAPEAYEEFTLPEGMADNPEAIETFRGFAKENDWTQEEAQKALDYYSDQVKNLFAEQDAAWKNVRQEWRDTAKKDEEFGGQSFTQNMGLVATAVDKFGTPELRKVLNETGVGDHPELIRFFYRVGKLAGEGEFITGEGGSSGEVDPAKVMYPSMG